MAITKAFAIVHDNVMSGLPAAIQVNHGGVLRGGYSWVGRIGAWNAVLLVTTEARLDIAEANAGNNAVVLVRMTEERGELDIDIDTGALAKINTWLQARGIEVESSGSARQIVRRLFRRFHGSFEAEFVDVN